jgi:hypothetical protein
MERIKKTMMKRGMSKKKRPKVLRFGCSARKRKEEEGRGRKRDREEGGKRQVRRRTKNRKNGKAKKQEQQEEIDREGGPRFLHRDGAF